METYEHIIFTKKELEYIKECIETNEEGLTPSQLGNKIKEKIQKEIDDFGWLWSD